MTSRCATPFCIDFPFVIFPLRNGSGAVSYIARRREDGGDWHGREEHERGAVAPRERRGQAARAVHVRFGVNHDDAGAVHREKVGNRWWPKASTSERRAKRAHGPGLISCGPTAAVRIQGLTRQN